MEQLPLCYADDLHAICSCPEATAKFNDVTSAFAAMFSVAFAPHKARAVSTRPDPGYMTLHGPQWEEIYVPFGGPDTLITSLGLEYSLSYQWDTQYADLLAKFRQVTLVLSRKHASLMAKSLLQNVSSEKKILYAAQFSPFTEKQLAKLTKTLIQPLRKSKAVGTCLAGEVLTNDILGGFSHDLGDLVQRHKLRLMDLAQNEGGATAAAMRGLLLRPMRRGLHDPTVNHAVLVAQPPIQGRNMRHWWASSTLARAPLTGDQLVFVGQPMEAPHISTVLPGLSVQAETFLENFDIYFVAELTEWGSAASGSLRPLDWLARSKSKGARELFTRLAEYLRRTPWIAPRAPISRGQLFKLSEEAFFQVAGRLPNGYFSGQYFAPDGRRGRILIPSRTHHSAARGSGYNTSLAPEALLAAGHIRAFAKTILSGKNKGHLELAATLLPPQLEPYLQRLPPNIQMAPYHPACFRILRDYLAQHNATPVLMCSDAGVSFLPRPPSAAFEINSEQVKQVTACIVACDRHFQPGIRPPCAAIIITGIERLIAINPFLGELVGCIAMELFRGVFPHVIPAFTDCESVIRLLLHQIHRDPATATTQRKPYGQLLRALAQARAPHQPVLQWVESHVDRARAKSASKPARPPIPPAERTTGMWANLIADRIAGAVGNALQLHKLEAMNYLPGYMEEIQVETLLEMALAPNSAYWCRAPPPPVSQDPPPTGTPSSHPLVPPVATPPPPRSTIEHFPKVMCSAQPGVAMARRAQAYLEHRDLSSQYPRGFWGHSQVGLLRDALTSICPARLADKRAVYLKFVLDHIPHGRKTAQYEGQATPFECPLCGEPDSLPHVLLECQHLDEQRQATLNRLSSDLIPQRRDRGQPYHANSLTPAVVDTLILIMEMIRGQKGDLTPDERTALWLGRPQSSTTRWLDGQTGGLRLSISSQRRMRKVLVKIIGQLILEGRQWWIDRCNMAQQPHTPSVFSPILAFTETPPARQSQIDDFLPSGGDRLDFPSDSEDSSAEDGAQGLDNPPPTPPDPLLSSFSTEAPLDHTRSRRNPSRAARHSTGDTSDYLLQSNYTGEGLIPPEDYHLIDNQSAELGIVPRLDDHRDTWVGPSILCPGAGKGFFFRLARHRAPGYLIGVYYGQDTRVTDGSKKMDRQLFIETLRSWTADDYVLSDAFSRYAVRVSSSCGPAMANDGFATTNCLFMYNPLLHRMELRTYMPLKPGIYEALVNYDIPGQRSKYWDQRRRDLLPIEARRACVFYYQAHSGASMSAQKFLTRRKNETLRSQTTSPPDCFPTPPVSRAGQRRRATKTPGPTRQKSKAKPKVCGVDPGTGPPPITQCAMIGAWPKSNGRFNPFAEKQT